MSFVLLVVRCRLSMLSSGRRCHGWQWLSGLWLPGSSVVTFPSWAPPDRRHLHESSHVFNALVGSDCSKLDGSVTTGEVFCWAPRSAFVELDGATPRIRKALRT